MSSEEEVYEDDVELESDEDLAEDEDLAGALHPLGLLPGASRLAAAAAEVRRRPARRRGAAAPARAAGRAGDSASHQVPVHRAPR